MEDTGFMSILRNSCKPPMPGLYVSEVFNGETPQEMDS